MNVISAPALAAGAVANNAARPATALAHDSADARVVLFRIEPCQEVAKHTSPSTVVLMIVWLIICILAKTGDIANTARLVGLAVGVISGYAPTLLKR